eukprot:m.216556 g.216556  ORF g.216556 m.216556 type:complete len:2486 (-) comp15879_c0_seq6:2229-9686(-)
MKILENMAVFTRDSILPTLLGGLVFGSGVANVVRLYTWITLFAVPVGISLAYENISLSTKLSWTVFVAAFFTFVCYANQRLHRMYDEQEPKEKDELDKKKETKNDDGSEHGSDAESKGGTDGSTIIDAGSAGNDATVSSVVSASASERDDDGHEMMHRGWNRPGHCPGGHGRMRRFVVESSAYQCDICGTYASPNGEEMYGCRSCPEGGYDECEACYNARFVAARLSMARRRRSSTARERDLEAMDPHEYEEVRMPVRRRRGTLYLDTPELRLPGALTLDDDEDLYANSHDIFNPPSLIAENSSRDQRLSENSDLDRVGPRSREQASGLSTDMSIYNDITSAARGLREIYSVVDESGDNTQSESGVQQEPEYASWTEINIKGAPSGSSSLETTYEKMNSASIHEYETIGTAMSSMDGDSVSNDPDTEAGAISIVSGHATSSAATLNETCVDSVQDSEISVKTELSSPNGKNIASDSQSAEKQLMDAEATQAEETAQQSIHDTSNSNDKLNKEDSSDSIEVINGMSQEAKDLNRNSVENQDLSSTVSTTAEIAEQQSTNLLEDTQSEDSTKTTSSPSSSPQPKPRPPHTLTKETTTARVTEVPPQSIEEVPKNFLINTENSAALTEHEEIISLLQNHQNILSEGAQKQLLVEPTSEPIAVEPVEEEIDSQAEHQTASSSTLRELDSYRSFMPTELWKLVSEGWVGVWSAEGGAYSCSLQIPPPDGSFESICRQSTLVLLREQAEAHRAVALSLRDEDTDLTDTASDSQTAGSPTRIAEAELAEAKANDLLPIIQTLEEGGPLIDLHSLQEKGLLDSDINLVVTTQQSSETNEAQQSPRKCPDLQVVEPTRDYSESETSDVTNPDTTLENVEDVNVKIGVAKPRFVIGVPFVGLSSEANIFRATKASQAEQSNTEQTGQEAGEPAGSSSESGNESETSTKAEGKVVPVEDAESDKNQDKKPMGIEGNSNVEEEELTESLAALTAVADAEENAASQLVTEAEQLLTDALIAASNIGTSPKPSADPLEVENSDGEKQEGSSDDLRRSMRRNTVFDAHPTSTSNANNDIYDTNASFDVDGSELMPRLYRDRRVRRRRMTQQRNMMSLSHAHPLSDGTLSSSGPWRCSHCPRRFGNRDPQTRFQCVDGCDFNLCRRCMLNTRAPYQEEQLRPLPPPPRPPAPSIADHDNTSPGTIHRFVDEDGTVHFYTFGMEGSTSDLGNLALQQQPPQPPQLPQLPQPPWPSGPQRPPRGIDLPFRPRPHPRNRPHIPSAEYYRRFLPENVFLRDDWETHPHPRRYAMRDNPTISIRDLPRHAMRTPVISTPPPPRKTMVYVLNVFGHGFRIFMTRATLANLLDVNKFPRVEIPLAVMLAIGTTWMAFELLKLYSNAGVVMLWFVIASAQFSLLKSVQPDPGSSLLGERALGFARAIYFLLLAALALVLDFAAKNATEKTQLYGIAVDNRHVVAISRDILSVIILALPFVWLFGHLPTWLRTMVHHLFEQIDIVIAGGGGSTTATGATQRFLLYVVLVAACSSVGYVALDPGQPLNGASSGAFSGFCGLVAFSAYSLSRLPADFKLFKIAFSNAKEGADQAHEDARAIMFRHRLAWDACIAIAACVAAAMLHLTGLFNAITPTASLYVFGAISTLGLYPHYLAQHLESSYPWLWFKEPFIIPKTTYRTMRYRCLLVESYIIWPVVALLCISSDTEFLVKRNGRIGAAILLSVVAIKLLRMGFSERRTLWQSLVFATLFFNADTTHSEGLSVDVFLSTLFVHYVKELQLRLGFALTYNAPWNLRDIWGCSLHALLYPLQIPHAAMFVFQSLVATIVGAPIYPVMGSSIFLVSYFRPIRFFERHYATKRIDDSENLKDPSQKRPRYEAGATANNLNSAFYHHLVRKLELSLSRDVDKGIWGALQAGDVFVLTDGGNSMTAFVHIIDKGNGYVSFQLRGLEFVGTYCQARELEALEKDPGEVEDALSRRCSMFSGCAKNVFAISAAFRIRWQTWAPVTLEYPLPGFSIALNAAPSMFNSYDLRRLLVTRLCESVIYHVIVHPNLEKWLNDENVKKEIEEVDEKSCMHHRKLRQEVDPDYDKRRMCIMYTTHCSKFESWMKYCFERLEKKFGDSEFLLDSEEAPLKKFLYLVNMFVRTKVLDKMRVMRLGTRVDEFLHGYHSVFRGDFSPKTEKDGWAFDLENLIMEALLPGVRMALRLHQDYFVDPDGYDDQEELYDSIRDCNQPGMFEQVVCSETDPLWMKAIFAEKPSLLSLRWNIEDSSNNREFFIPVITRQERSYKIFKLNKESVRGLWAAQQQELLFFKNAAKERGSIQNAKTVLRNMISQSCDQPVGYPIYVSEYTYSFSTNWNVESPWAVARRLLTKLGSAIVKKRDQPQAPESQVSSAGLKISETEFLDLTSTHAMSNTVPSSEPHSGTSDSPDADSNDRDEFSVQGLSQDEAYEVSLKPLPIAISSAAGPESSGTDSGNASPRVLSDEITPAI